MRLNAVKHKYQTHGLPYAPSGFVTVLNTVLASNFDTYSNNNNFTW